MTAEPNMVATLPPSSTQGPVRYEGDRWTLIVGDVLDVLAHYDGEPFDAVLTDPPYSSGGATRGDRMASTLTKYVNSDSGNQDRLPDFEGDNRDQRAFLVWCSLWLSAAWAGLPAGRHAAHVRRLAPGCPR